MAQDYTITAVVKRDPWSNDFGKFQTYAVQFDKTGEQWIQWNKKFKGDEEPTPPKTGDEVFGDIANGKFKIGKKDGGYTASNSFKGSEKKEWVDNSDVIRAQFAIKAAVQAAGTVDPKTALDTYVENIEYLAHKFYALVDVVKGGESTGLPKSSGYETFKAAGGQVKSELPPADSYEDIIDSGEPIDMSKIPF